MTKPEDIEFEEAWPTIHRLIPWLFRGVCIWFIYQGVLLVLGVWGWPLTFPEPVASMETYQQWVQSEQNSLQLFQWMLGPMFLFVAVFLNRGLIRRMLNRRTEEVQKEE